MTAQSRNPKMHQLECLRSALTVAGLFGLAAWLGIELTRETGRVALIWVANGGLIAIILSSPRSRWPTYFAASFVANVFANLATGDSLLISSALSFANSTEVIIAVLLMRRRFTTMPDLTSWSTLFRFALFGALLAPLTSALIAAVFLAFSENADFYAVLQRWFLADALGIIIVTPLVLAIRNRSFATALRSAKPLEYAFALALVIICTVCVFIQSSFSLLFLIYTPLIFVAFRLGFAGAVTAISTVALISIGLTIAGFGPFSLVDDTSFAEHVVFLQIFIACVSATTLPVVATLAERTRIASRLNQTESSLRFFANNSTTGKTSKPKI